MSAVGGIRDATLISEFPAAIKAAQDIGLSGPRVEQGNGHDPAPSHQQSNVYVTKYGDSNGGCGRNKRSSVIVYHISNAELPPFVGLAVLGSRFHERSAGRALISICCVPSTVGVPDVFELIIEPERHNSSLPNCLAI
jgi:hypothetical protein